MKKRSDLIIWVCAAVIAATIPMSAYAKAKNRFPTLSTGLTASPLEQSFKTPPDSAKAWCIWWWLNGMASKEGNQLEIEVANHWLNRIIGDEKLTPEERFTQTNVEAKKTPLQPSGLLGPVCLFIAQAEEGKPQEETNATNSPAPD